MHKRLLRLPIWVRQWRRSRTSAADHLLLARLLMPIVLLVEDEVVVRLVLADHLRACGCKVFEAGSAAEALEVLQADMPVDLVFSDVQMPGEMDGTGLEQWVRHHRPEVRVLLTSGHAGVAQKADRLCAEILPVLPTPQDPANVLRQISRLLGGS